MLEIEEAGYAKMNKGDCLAFLGGLYHAGGHNLTTDQYRPVHDLSNQRILETRGKRISRIRKAIGKLADVILLVGECIPCIYNGGSLVLEL